MGVGRMKTKAEIYQEELLLIEEIKELSKTWKRKIKDPSNLLTPIKNNRDHNRWEHMERKRQLEVLLHNLKETIRLSKEVEESIDVRMAWVNRVMDVVCKHTQVMNEEQTLLLRRELSQFF